MRTTINLATQPYEDARQFLIQWSLLLGALVLLAGALTYGVITRWHNYREMTSNVSREKQVLAEFDSKQAQDLAILNKSSNQDVRERSDFINGLIRTKQVSWTRIFTHLEKMMPPHLRVLSVTPKLDQDQFIITLQLGGDSRERAAELVRRMEQSRAFRNARFVTEVDTGGPAGSAGQSDPYRYQVEAEYVPENEMPESPLSTTPATTAANHGGQQ
jgi:Tfp pilus assembly protein PilN